MVISWQPHSRPRLRLRSGVRTLYECGYHNLIGFDPAPAMVALARERFPAITFEELNSPYLPLADASVDATLLFTVLTCVPTDHGQRTIVEEVGRVLQPGGLLYVSDLWLQTDERNIARYVRDEPKYGTYGVFDLPEGVTVRHHDPRWIETLTRDFDTLALDHIDVVTMNGHSAKVFQWFGFKTKFVKNAAEQIVGRERNQRASYRQLAHNAVVSRRVNSTVMPHQESAYD